LQLVSRGGCLAVAVVEAGEGLQSVNADLVRINRYTNLLRLQA